MKYVIRHESAHTMRVHMGGYRMSMDQADILEYYLKNLAFVQDAKVYDETGDARITYKKTEKYRGQLLEALCTFSYQDPAAIALVPEETGRALNHQYQEKLAVTIAGRYLRKLFLPLPVQIAWTALRSVKFIARGIQCLLQGKLQVPVLDASAIAASMLMGDFDTASSVMWLLDIGDLLEEWTHKKSVGDLARTMSLNVSKVWLKKDGQEILVSADQIHEGDCVVIHMGNVIPFDGIVAEGDAMVNQASLTGESVPVRRTAANSVYAGTVVEEGELTVEVKKTGGASRFDKIVKMIEESEKLKSGLESKAEHLADRLVPYTLAGTALTYVLTRNVTKTLSVLMVDFSCALKLAMPISVLSAIREAGQHKVTVKGGRYLEATAEAQTIVFDKTGTLTKAKPTVVKVESFNGQDPDELLRIAACLEEHFPHSMAKAVVQAAQEKNLQHEEMHSKVEYIVAHGISTLIEGRHVVIGSHHFVFEDEKCTIPEGKQELFDSLPEEYSHLYMAIENSLAAVICIEDPLREEAPEVIRALHEAGLNKIVMMTGDSERTARAISARVGVDEYYSEVLPEDKAGFIEKEKAAGRKVIMIGDGINDSPALSAADVGIAISDGAEIAREIADITVGADDLYQVVMLRQLSELLMKRIHRNYRFIVGFNSALIALGVTGVLMPTTSAMLHNTSTLAISLKSMQNLL